MISEYAEQRDTYIGLSDWIYSPVILWLTTFLLILPIYPLGRPCLLFITRCTQKDRRKKKRKLSLGSGTGGPLLPAPIGVGKSLLGDATSHEGSFYDKGASERGNKLERSLSEASKGRRASFAGFGKSSRREGMGLTELPKDNASGPEGNDGEELLSPRSLLMKTDNRPASGLMRRKSLSGPNNLLQFPVRERNSNVCTQIRP